MENALWLNERELTSVEKISLDATNDGIMSDFNYPGNNIISEVVEAGLRSRDGRGDPVGRYMQALSEYEGEKSITTGIVNSRLDEMLALQNPYSLILGMYLSAKATFAKEVILFVSKENQFIAQMLNIRIRQLEKMGYFKSYSVDFSVDIVPREHIIYSQDLSLLTNYRENLSQARSPYNGAAELWDNKKHFISNVETFLNISLVIRNGSEWFRSSGIKHNYGSKIFYVNNEDEECLIEVDMGSTLREMMKKASEKIYLPDQYVLHIGGELGCYIPQTQLDLEIDYESFRDAGLLLGAGAVEILPDEENAKEILEKAIQTSHEKSCGRCSVCREGTKRLGELVLKQSNERQTQNLEKIYYLGNSIRNSALCGYGKIAINMIMTAAKKNSFSS